MSFFKRKPTAQEIFDFLANIRINVYLCSENIKYTYDYGKTYSTNTCFERTGCN